MAYYSMCLPHEISNDLPSPPPTGPDGRYQTYKELIETMDILIGRVVKTLDELKICEDTLILFAGDNGTPPAFISRYENGEYIKEPLYSIVNGEKAIGGKKQLTDAGTHVPLIASWPGTTPAGTVCDDLVDFTDFLPTFADLAHTLPPENLTIDGISFLPQILGQKNPNSRKWSYCQWDGQAWVRTKHFKLYRDGRFYDMKRDPLEQSPIDHDTAASKRARTKLVKILSLCDTN
ncbi:MAG: sulfatase-like hydrolase/transferase [candidate division KSB1 bacterium]|nr:sulfatase-like hydrolase/transferase [candidate division KSB1 bacterium]